MIAPPILRIAVPAPLYRSFDYLPPADCDPTALRPGVRLLVPFGNRERIGVLLEVGHFPSEFRLKPARALLDAEPLLGTEDLALLRWAAEYYQHPIGEVIEGALPVRLRQAKPSLAAETNALRLTAVGRAVDLGTIARARRQVELLAALAAGPLSTEHLAARCGECGGIVRTLKEKGWIEGCVIDPESAALTLAQTGPELNPGQGAAVEAVIEAWGRFQPFLLDGVTGSGKTEVYLRLVGHALGRGEQVLLLVPEIGLTPQLVRRFRRRVAAPIALLHSGLSATEREQAWHAARSGRARVVIGTRSAVFTPLPQLGLILVDEEHDLSFKQQEGFRYSARDVAVVRAQRRGCAVVLGSATPSFESLQNADRDRYRRLVLPQRAGNAVDPRLDLIDLRGVRLQGGLSPALLKLIREAVAAGGQVLLFLNRRGYAPQLICHGCGWVAQCRRCDARMTVHRADGLLWCHHCGAQQRLDRNCPECGGSDLRPFGRGTERLEETLQALFPEQGVVRIDRDSTRRKGSLERLLEEIREGRHALLLGTQMLAKGHHFPQVILVGILDADQGLYGADYRAAERMAQQIIQVAGRAGRAERPGRVAIQTHHPDHPLLQTLIRQGYHAFAEAGLAERREAELPPFSHQVLLRAEAVQEDAPRAFLERAAGLFREAAGGGVEVLGPIPAPMERRAGKYRAHLLLQSPQRGILQQLLAGQMPALVGLPEGRRARWSVDVDPQEML